MVYHVDSHVASCSMEIHMVNHEVGMRCTHKWLIANRDTTQPVQCFCAAAFCHLAREMTKKRRRKQEFAIPQNPKFKLFGGLTRISVMTTIPKPFLNHRSSF